MGALASSLGGLGRAHALAITADWLYLAAFAA